MKLAEALLQRSDLQRRATELEKRLSECALVQEGDEPPDEPRALLAELRGVLVAQRVVLVAINKSNLRTLLADGKTTLTEALAQRDVWRAEVSVLRKLVEAAHPGGQYRSYRVTRSEVRFVPTIDRAAVHRELDDRSRALRELNIQIQQANWASELFES